MRIINRVPFFLILVLSCSSCDLFDNNSGVPINENIWVNAYLASWNHDPETENYTGKGNIKTDDIDWDAMTHMTYFSLNIAEDGTPSQSLDPDVVLGNFNSERLNNIVPAAHAHNTKIIFSVGGGGNYEGFSSSIREENRNVFIQTLVNILVDYGFDGVNLNMTPIDSTDYGNYRAFVTQLHDTLSSITTRQNERPLITVAALKNQNLAELYSGLQQYLDQINILTFDMAQPWRGWQVWHNSALYNKNKVFENNAYFKFPSINDKVDQFIDTGIERMKIGITINFHASVWEGVNLYGTWPSWPTQNMSIYDNLSYTELVDKYDISDPSWDKNAKVPYMNLNDPNTFVSFENDASIKKKIKYAQKKRIGGVMIWELGSAFFPEKDPKDPLLKMVKKHAFID